MSRKIVSATGIVVVVALGAVGCDDIFGKQPNDYCERHPEDIGCSGPDNCRTDEDCTGNNGVCDTTDNTCVACLPPDRTEACDGKTPVCKDTTCAACSAHAECGSLACLPDGACGDDSNVAYVDADSGIDNMSCTRSEPCKRIMHALQLQPERPFLKLRGTFDEQVTVSGGRRIAFLADPGAKLTTTGPGPILTVDGPGNIVDIFDLSIGDAPNTTNGFGLLVTSGSDTSMVSLTRATVSRNAAGGISAQNGALVIARSTISDNLKIGVIKSNGSLVMSQSTLALNIGGGLKVDAATFDVTNTFIYRNGSDQNSLFGGVSLAFIPAPGNRFAFNTIADNRAAVDSGGIICNATFDAPNNIVARNSLAESTTNPEAQKRGACAFSTSLIQADLTGLGFSDPDLPAPFDYKLTEASTAAIDKATTVVDVAFDHDAEDRPQRLNKDIGADEIGAAR